MDLSTVKFKRFEKQYVIRETLLDVYGHMNNASYVQLYEEARWDLISSQGYGLKRIFKEKIGPVVLSLQTDFIKEITSRELITITTQITKYSGKIGNIHQEMIKEDGTLASKADFTFGMFDLAARKLVLPTDEWVKALAGI